MSGGGNSDKYRHVLVIWMDIAGSDSGDGWTDISEAKRLKPGRMITSGWILKEDPNYLVVASSFDTEEGLVGDLNAIPRCVIEEISDIQVVPGVPG
jgi:hypothetical protein